MTDSVYPLMLRVTEYRGRGAGEKNALLAPADAERLGVTDGDAVRVWSESGRLTVLAVRVGGVREGSIGLDRFTRESLAVKPGDKVYVDAIWGASRASRLVVAPLKPAQPVAPERLATWLKGRYVAIGELLIPSNAPVTRVVVVDAEPRADTLLVHGDTMIVVDETPVAQSVWSTRPLPPRPARICRGERLHDALILGIEPGPCAWLWPGTRSYIVDKRGLLETIIKEGLVEEALKQLTSHGRLGDTPLQAVEKLLILILYALLAEE